MAIRRFGWCAALVFLAGAAAARGAGFELSPVTGEQGVKVTEMVLSDFAKDEAGKLHEQKGKFVLESRRQEGAVAESTWKSDVGNVVVRCVATKKEAGTGFEFMITNGITHRIESLDIQLPQAHVALDAGNKIYTPFRGGRESPWPTDDWQKGQGNSSLWPSTAFSPLVTLWNEKTQETLGITFFNRTLTPVLLFWFSGPANGQQHLNPFLRVQPGLEPGQTLTIGAEYVPMTGGPAAHQKKYREEMLAPFMKELGIPEAAGGTGKGPIAMSAWVDKGKLAENMRAAQAAGITTYIQWSPPDGASTFFNPYPPQLPWFGELGIAKQIPGTRLGVLINPYVTPPLRSDAFALKSGRPYTNLKLNFAAPENRQYYAALRDELVKKGVTVAFWDTGNGPENINGHEWLKLLANWKNAGIAIMPETSCDLAAWTTGLWMEYPYSWGDYGLAKRVCPQATLAAHTNTPDQREGVTWDQDATRKEVWPILEINDLLKRPNK